MCITMHPSIHIPILIVRCTRLFGPDYGAQNGRTHIHAAAHTDLPTGPRSPSRENAWFRVPLASDIPTADTDKAPTGRLERQLEEFREGPWQISRIVHGHCYAGGWMHRKSSLNINCNIHSRDGEVTYVQPRHDCRTQIDKHRQFPRCTAPKISYQPPPWNPSTTILTRKSLLPPIPSSLYHGHH